jgi:hypothetical protein
MDSSVKHAPSPPTPLLRRAQLGIRDPVGSLDALLRNRGGDYTALLTLAATHPENSLARVASE